MVEMTTWIQNFLQVLQETFGERVWFVGLQGSYGRGEATETSDIDMVVILDRVSASDLQRYRAMLEPLPHRELICGFFSGKNELLNWEPSDLFQFYFDTTPIFGSLETLLPKIDDAAVSKAIHTGICNLYHGCVHNLLHDRNDEMVRGLYKAASFVVQAIVYQQTGTYIRHLAELLAVASEPERCIVETFLELKHGGAVDLEPMSERLFSWVQEWIFKIQETN